MCDDSNTTTNSEQHKINLMRKISKLRELAINCDWSKDGFMAAAGMSYPYLSAGKIRKNIAPLFNMAGLEAHIDFGTPMLLAPVGEKQLLHWLATLNVVFTDIDTGYNSETYTYFGEGVDKLDKALRKAQTDAIKTWLSSLFLLEDGIDTEMSSDMTSNVYTPRSDEPVESATLKAAAPAAEKAAKAPRKAKKAEEPKVEETPAPAAEEPAKPAETPVESKPAEPELTTPAPTTAPAAPTTAAAGAPLEILVDPDATLPGAATGYDKKISESQKKPMIGTMKRWNEKAKAGTVDKATYEAVATAYLKVAAPMDVIQFVKTYKVKD